MRFPVMKDCDALLLTTPLRSVLAFKSTADPIASKVSMTSFNFLFLFLEKDLLISLPSSKSLTLLIMYAAGVLGLDGSCLGPCLTPLVDLDDL